MSEDEHGEHILGDTSPTLGGGGRLPGGGGSELSLEDM